MTLTPERRTTLPLLDLPTAAHAVPFTPST
jgi:hypothetical protein